MNTIARGTERNLTAANAERAPSTEADFRTGFAVPTSYLDIGYAKVAYYRFGEEGPDLFFVHGWPVSAMTFRRVLPWFASRYRCHLIDLPGAGQSRCDDASKIEIAAHAAAVRRIVNELRLERFAYVAHDSGAVIARMAAADDERVAALVLAGTEIPGYHPPAVKMYVALSKVPFAPGLLRRLMRLRAVRTSPVGFGGCFADPAYGEGEFRQLFIEPLLASKAGFDESMALMASVDFKLIDELSNVHRRIHAPTELIWGTRDPFFPIALARKMTPEFAGGAEFDEIENAKLFSHEDHPSQFAALAMRFLERQLGADRAEQAIPRTRSA